MGVVFRNALRLHRGHLYRRHNLGHGQRENYKGQKASPNNQESSKYSQVLNLIEERQV